VLKLGFQNQKFFLDTLLGEPILRFDRYGKGFRMISVNVGWRLYCVCGRKKMVEVEVEVEREGA